ncbi:flagellar basal body protein [Rhodoferax sp.]|uniref:flagellar basal body protein n=1 Tax=Rhodoferax sp. TaxID=50421 RepID=UPI00374D08DD
MNSISSISLSGLQAAQTRLDSSAQNIANGQTEGFRRLEVQQQTQTGGGVSTQVERAAVAGDALETDMVDQLQAKNSFLANLAVFKTNDRMLGSLLDTQA